ncbi:TetR/AcrR family transcriptional regulator [Microbacterium stercoris]|uniref:TetR family transcriptional regulator n=1 Tax=Microbacterium stercoris TaxID=2820289 RepID=A0A939TLJ2_9MICO|nr:TetR family transcriptional regulator C-terminal domain-containing protein [Microbacterium stercoris]MBO3662173.1 TetR family transcriptional regulator [Microbacterium stercoris]
MSIPTVDGRRLRGDASRRSILAHATDLASVEGLDGVSFGRLAEVSGHSKSSIATLFRGKEALQLATVEAAAEVFRLHVVEPARALPRGAPRVAALLRATVEYSRARVFTGGCFFSAISADVDSKPGPVRDEVRRWQASWRGYVEAQLRHARDLGELAPDVDPEGLAFELLAYFTEANARSLLTGEEQPYDLACRAMRGRLLAAGAPSAALDELT